MNRNPEKQWLFALIFGGGSNYWAGNTPRLLPEDFETFSKYGVGTDWPLSYSELEPYYCDAEDLMAVSGSSTDCPAPRSRDYPLPAHRLSTPDELLKEAFPERFHPLPSARPSVRGSGRPRCCASSICSNCPIDSKFTVLNSGIGTVFDDPRVDFVPKARVTSVDLQAGQARGVEYLWDGKSHQVRGDLVVLGANAIMNPFLLQRSGLDHERLGRGLCEQVGVSFDALLGGVDNFQGSTFQTGHGYMLYGGRRERATKAPALLETTNAPLLRMERGKWRQRALFKFVVEDVPRMDNIIRPNPDDPSQPEVIYHGHSEYADRAIADLPRRAAELFSSAFPIERLERLEMPGPSTEGHMQCTVPFGNDPVTSIVDRELKHHAVRNLLVLGASAFPTCPPANPTLTLSALSLWAADRLTLSQAA